MLTVMTLEDALELRETANGTKVTAQARFITEAIDWIVANVPKGDDGTYLYCAIDVLAQTTDDGEPLAKSSAAKVTYVRHLKNTTTPDGMTLAVSTKLGRTKDAKGTPLSLVCNLAGKPSTEEEVKSYREAFEAFQLAQLEQEAA